MEVRRTYQPSSEQPVFEPPFDLFLCFGFKDNVAEEHSVLCSYPENRLMSEGHSYIANLGMICFPDDLMPKQV